MKDYDYHRPAEKVLLDSYQKAEPEQKPSFVSGSCTYRWSDFLYDKFCLWEDPGGHPETYPDRWNDGVNVS